MKLKQRIVITIGLTFILSAVFTLYFNIIGLIHGEHEDDMKPSLRDFENPFDDIQDKQGPLQAPAHERGGNDLLIDAIKAHLSVARRDLDVSNYSSNSDTPLQNHLLSLNNLKELKESVLHDPVIQENADTIIEIAHILGTVHKADTSDEVVENKGEAEKPDRVNTKHEETAHERSDRDIPVANATRIVRKQPKAIEVPPAFRPFETVLREDEVMQRFELPDIIVQQLDRFMAKDREIFKKNRNRHIGKTLEVHKTSFIHSTLSHWEQFHNHISQFRLYDPSDRNVIRMMEEMGTARLTSYYQDSRGTQLKLIYYLSTQQQVMFKPMRYPREQETLPDHFYFSDFERHNAEIAAFHLDKVLGFYRVPPTVGRRINVTYDVKRTAKPQMLKTFFVSPAGNICFHGECDYYCDTGHAVCGHPDVLEGSMQAYLPSSRKVKRKTWKHPWKRSYHKRNRAEWETDSKYCANVKTTPPYDAGRRLLDLMDMAVFDFFTGNMDRHHYDTFLPFGNFTFPILMDNGRGFGKSKHDELSILAPIYQCCLIRYSTLQKLVDFHKGPTHLSTAMRKSMAADVAQPVLLEPHFVALDRRVKIILKTVHKCIERNGYFKVVQNDGF